MTVTKQKMNINERFLYVYSCDLDEINVQVKIGTLEGKFEKPKYDDLLKDPSLQHCVALQDEAAGCRDLFIECEVFCDGRRIGLPVSTSYKALSTRWNWNEWLALPIRYNELSRNARLSFTIYDLHDSLERHVVGGTTIDLFSKRGVFRQGMYDLNVWPYVAGDGTSAPSLTPGKLKTNAEAAKSQMSRLSKLSKKHRGGMMEKVDWLDRLTFREIEMINEKEKRSANSLFLMVEFPFVPFNNVEHSVVYFERNGDEYQYFQPFPNLVLTPDSELGLENLVEAKHHVLARSARVGISDRELKPESKIRDQLQTITEYPPNMELTSEEKDLLWKFRFFLQSNKKALAKFLQCVNWDLINEVNQAIDVLNDWSPMDVDDSLELLSSKFTHAAVRRYAVKRLKEAGTNEDLSLYLLQLVQALKYENFDEIQSGADPSFVQEVTGTSVFDPNWRMDSSSVRSTGVAVGQNISVDIAEDASSVFSTDLSVDENVFFDGDAKNDPSSESETDLATFLISIACKDASIANYLYWYLKVECDSYTTTYDTAAVTQHQQERGERIRAMYKMVLLRLSRALAKGGVEARRRRAHLVIQQKFVDRIVKIMSAVMKESGNRKKKIEYLQTLLSENDNFANLDMLPLPLDPTIKVQSIIAEKASLFNSTNIPCKLTFRTVDGRDYTSIFKHGDDLRQDQLIIQIITLMDKCLRKENLDLRLTTYKVLATSTSQGFVQFIDSQPLRDVLHDWNSIQEYFRYYRPSPNGPYGIEKEVIENYVRSCAGYSVICYLLGVGDRHQHNLLLCHNGRLFHVDFGYILGRDPKPLPPPMKLTKEMIEGMGGISSPHWREFRTLCDTCFLHLRRHANLILNLFALMIDASIPDIALEPDKTVKKVQERFLLEKTDEEAVQSMQQLIDDSVSAKMAAFVDMMHDVAQYLRA